MINIILRNRNNVQKIIEANNISISADIDGIIVDVKNPIKIFNELKEAEFTVEIEGKLLKIDCKSIYCF